MSPELRTARTGLKRGVCRPVLAAVAVLFVGGRPPSCSGQQTAWEGCYTLETATENYNSDTTVSTIDCRDSSVVLLDKLLLTRLQLLHVASRDRASYGNGTAVEEFLAENSPNSSAVESFNLTFDVVDFSSSGITGLGSYSFEGLNTTVLNVSMNELTKITANSFDGLQALVLDLSYNAITTVESRSFENATITILNLGFNHIRTLPGYVFAGMAEAARINLESNAIGNVFRDAFAEVQLANLSMIGNPSVCFLLMASGRPVCRCERAGAGVFDDFCISCPETFEVRGIEWRGIYPEDGLNTTGNATQSEISERFIGGGLGLMEGETLGVKTASLNFSCGDGAVEGQDCIIGCRPGFLGRPVTYECFSNGEWGPEDNRTFPTCIMYMGSLTPSNETNGTEEVPPLVIEAAVAGYPFLLPPPRVYGTDLRFNSLGLPPGVTMDKNGQLQGIPTQHGNFSVTIYARDHYGVLTPAASFLLVVAPPLSTSEQKVVSLIMGRAHEYGHSLKVIGGLPPFAFFVRGQLPPGMHLAPSGIGPIVYGTPESLGEWKAVLLVTDDANTTRSFAPVTFVVIEDDQYDNFRNQFFFASGLSVVLMLVSVVLARKKRRDPRRESAHLASKIAKLELGTRRPMRTMVLSHTESLMEQAVAFEEEKQPGASSAASTSTHDSLSTSSLHSLSSQIGLTGYEKCCVGTRIYRRDSIAPLDPSTLVPLEMFLAKASFYSKHILIAAPLSDVNLCRGIADLLQRCRINSVPGQDFSETELVRIPYWGKFTPPLNILLRHATLNKDKWLLFQSVEVLAEQRAVTTLLSHMDDKTLVAGLALDNSHLFSEGVQALNGLTSPWNTFAIWNVEMLGRTGFLPISDGVPPLASDAAGVEEVAAIALIQTLFPDCAEAKLIRIPASLYTWDIDFNCEARFADHQKKMRSKMDRPKRQLLVMGEIRNGRTRHIDLRVKSAEQAHQHNNSEPTRDSAGPRVTQLMPECVPLLEVGDEQVDIGNPIDEMNLTNVELIASSEL